MLLMLLMIMLLVKIENLYYYKSYYFSYKIMFFFSFYINHYKSIDNLTILLLPKIVLYLYSKLLYIILYNQGGQTAAREPHANTF